MSEHNFKIKSVKQVGQTYLCQDTLCPSHDVDIKLAVRTDGQHDGHPWNNEVIQVEEQEMVSAILEALRPHLVDVVKKINPFSIHRTF